MAKLQKNIYIIQKFVRATTLAEALKKEGKGTIVNVCLSIGDPDKSSMTPAVGFQLKLEGNENISYE